MSVDRILVLLVLVVIAYTSLNQPGPHDRPLEFMGTRYELKKDFSIMGIENLIFAPEDQDIHHATDVLYLVCFDASVGDRKKAGILAQYRKDFQLEPVPGGAFGRFTRKDTPMAAYMSEISFGKGTAAAIVIRALVGASAQEDAATRAGQYFEALRTVDRKLHPPPSP